MPLFDKYLIKRPEQELEPQEVFIDRLTQKRERAHGTKEMKFDFSATPLANGYLFKGEFDINRRDFNVGGSSFSMSDILHVSLIVTASK